MVEWISEEQRARISELIADFATSWPLQQETSWFLVVSVATRNPRSSGTVGSARSMTERPAAEDPGTDHADELEDAPAKGVLDESDPDPPEPSEPG